MGRLLVHITHGPEVAEMAMPDRLVQLTFEADRVLTY